LYEPETTVTSGLVVRGHGDSDNKNDDGGTHWAGNVQVHVDVFGSNGKSREDKLEWHHQVVEWYVGMPAAVASARPNTAHDLAQDALVLDFRNSPSQAPTFSATPATKSLQISPMCPPAQSDAQFLYQSDAAILDQLNAFYLHYDQKIAGNASIIWRDLQMLFAGNAATELENALMIKYGCNLRTFAKMKSAPAVGEF